MSLEEFLEEWNNDSPYVEVKTSGSTGEPKRMLVEKQRMRASARITCDFLGLKAGDTALLCMSLDYIAGKMMVVRAIERNLRLITVEPSGHPLAEQIRREWDLRSFRPLLASPRSALPLCSAKNLGEELAAMVPMQVYNSLQVTEERERLKQIRHLIIGGGAIDEALAEDLRTFPNNVWSTYGMTETLSHVALRRLSGGDATEWYTPLPSVRVSLAADGCLKVVAPLVCEGELTTRDLAELHPDGVRFRLLGRKDNVIVSGGLKIQAEAVEEALRGHLDVPFMVTRCRDARLGQTVVLMTTGSTDGLAALCRRVLPAYWQPRHIVHVDRLPLTPTGKLARHEAEQLFLSLEFRIKN
jgi:O-succinylbenzoic acid--CoA ligase